MELKNTLFKSLTLVAAFCSISCSTNKASSNKDDYESSSKIADSLFENGALDSSLDHYLRINNKYKNREKEFYYKIAGIYSIKKQTNKAFKFIKKGIEKDSTLWILEEPNFYNLINTEQWKEIENQQLTRFETKHGKFKKRELTRLTYRMFLKDQSNYYEYEHFENKDYYLHLKEQLNQENLADLEKIIKDIGWPTISKVGSELSETAFLIIQHQENLSKQEEYLTLVEDALKNNDIQKWNYAYLKDRVLIREGKKQIYGTQLSFDDKKDESYFEVSSLEDPATVNLRRKEMGLEPIEDYLLKQNIVWDASQMKIYQKK